MLTKLITCISLAAFYAGSAQAGFVTSAPYMTGSFAITVTEGITYGNGFNTLPGVQPFFASTAAASFLYTGALDFNNAVQQNLSADLNKSFFSNASNISDYSGRGSVKLNSTTVADYSSLMTFLDSSGSSADYKYASFYTIHLGKLATGTILDIRHDDGVSVFQDTTRIGPTVDGPTAAVTDQVKLTATADTVLYYSRQNGTPSILQVDVPEPTSTAILGVGLAGLGLIQRRRRSSTAAGC